MTKVETTPVPGIVWVFLVLGVLAAVLGVLAVGFGGYGWCVPRPTFTTEEVVVEAASGKHPEILARLKKYVESPGPGYPFARPAQLRGAGIFPPLGRTVEVGETRAATPVEPNPEAIQDALEKLEPGARMTWSWGPKQEPHAWPVSSAWRGIDVTRSADGSCHLRVADVRQVPVKQD